MSSENPTQSRSNATANQQSDLERSFLSVLKTVETLRGPTGCPWDKEQTHESLIPYAIEEAFEMAQAIESKDEMHFKDELGDVLFQVLIHAVIAQERQTFTLKDVMDNLNEKLIRRHPHVFSGENLPDMAAIWKRWDEIKAEEKKNKPQLALEVSPLPALQRADKIGRKTNKLQFDWSSAEDVKAKLDEEITEIAEARESKNAAHLEEEMGDFLFTAAQWSRHLGIDPEAALRKANDKFLSRFNQMMELVRKENRQFSELSASEKESYWQKIKKLQKA